MIVHYCIPKKIWIFFDFILDKNYYVLCPLSRLMNILNKSIGVFLVVFFAFGILFLIQTTDGALKPLSTPSLKKTINLTPKSNITPTQRITTEVTLPAKLSDYGYYNEGMKLFNQSRPIQAIVQFDKAIELNPSFTMAWLGKARAQLKIVQYQSAVESYGRVNQLEPGNFDAWYEKARLLERLKRFKEAFEAYNKALSLKPDNEDLKRYRDQMYVLSVQGFSFGAEMGVTPLILIPF